MIKRKGGKTYMLFFVRSISSSKAFFILSSNNAFSNCCACKRFSTSMDMECTSMTRALVLSQNSASKPNSSSNALSSKSVSDLSSFFRFLTGSFNVTLLSEFNSCIINSVSTLDLNHHGKVRKCLM